MHYESNFFIHKKKRYNMPGVNKIIGIYHADGGLIGEFKYITGKFFGGSHCSLCDITHSSTGKKNSWKKCEERLRMPIDFVHLNERKPSLEKYTKDLTPCIVGKTSTNYVLLVSKDELIKCEGDPEALSNILEKKLSN